MPIREQIILLISDDAALAAAARQKFDSREKGVRVAAVGSIEGARRALENLTPAVIVLDESSLSEPSNRQVAKAPHLGASAAALAVSAPVVTIAAGSREKDVASLIAVGAADFVPRSAECVSAAMKVIERRLRQARTLSENLPDRELTKEYANDTMGDFGGILRHELNNPLTGILGNAELLLAEVRRKGGDHMPPGGQQRLETIAALAVRLRETVRRLSQEWEAQYQSAPPHCEVGGSISLPMSGDSD